MYIRLIVHQIISRTLSATRVKEGWIGGKHFVLPVNGRSIDYAARAGVPGLEDDRYWLPVRHCIRARWDRATNEEEMIDDATMALRVRKGL